MYLYRPLGFLLFCARGFAVATSPEVVAEFVALDYVWDSSHSRAEYENDGLFKVNNNAISGIKASWTALPDFRTS
jgi:hypothetical protein